MSHIAAPVGVLDSWPYRYDISIDSNTTEYNIREAVEDAGWDGQSRLIVILRVFADVYSNNNGHWAMRSGDFQGWLHEPIRIVLEENIVGGGGYGGDGNPGADGSPGDAGGYGFIMDGDDEVIFEGNGTLSGGGGGGGGGNGRLHYITSTDKNDPGCTNNIQLKEAGAGGGGGAAAAQGGNSSTCNDGETAGITSGGNGGNGCVRVGAGGDGGNWGNNGNNGHKNQDGATCTEIKEPGSGGIRGFYINTTTNVDFGSFNGSTRGRAP